MAAAARERERETLPDVIRETEAEHRRSLGRVYERAFPCAESPSAYHDLFEVQRYNNIIVKRWLISEKRRRKRERGRMGMQNQNQQHLEKVTGQLAAACL